LVNPIAKETKIGVEQNWNGKIYYGYTPSPR
jgi:hypothetical protein